MNFTQYEEDDFGWTKRASFSGEIVADLRSLVSRRM
jgi:hypothetical protein